jgi:flagellar biogenesis protein FliO
MHTVRCLLPAGSLLTGGALAKIDHAAASLLLALLMVVALAYGVMRAGR